MDDVTTIEFADALARLQPLRGEEVRIQVNFRGTFGGCALEGRLSELYRVPPDHQAVEFIIDGRKALILDPIDTVVLLARHADGDGGWWLEFHLLSGVVASVEPTCIEPNRAREGVTPPTKGLCRCEGRVRRRSRR